jgi:hypothetical protein
VPGDAPQARRKGKSILGAGCVDLVGGQFDWQQRLLQSMTALPSRLWRQASLTEQRLPDARDAPIL